MADDLGFFVDENGHGVSLVNTKGVDDVIEVLLPHNRHPREGGGPTLLSRQKQLGSRLRGNDEMGE